MKSINKVSVKNKTIILRVNFDVPIKGGKVLDDTRIKESLPTIKYLLENKAKVLIISHLGRPKNNEKVFSLLPVKRSLEKILKRKVIFVKDILSFDKEKDKDSIILFENIRFYKQEGANDLKFAKKIAKYGDIYINDAFPVSHRKHSTVVSLPKYLPSFLGLSLEKEIKELSKVKNNPKNPFVLIIGGAKIKDKLGVILNLYKKTDYILVGGGSADTLLLAKGCEIGNSLADKKHVKTAKKIINIAGSKIYLPTDVLVSKSINSKKTEIREIINKEICKAPYAIYDIGPKTIKEWSNIIKKAKTVFWSGDLGVFEKVQFSMGTAQIAKAIAKNKNTTVIGGGDTVTAVNQLKLRKFTFISTAGGAMLKYISGEKLPGIEALNRKVRHVKLVK